MGGGGQFEGVARGKAEGKASSRGFNGLNVR
jgi:hypothetical protein